jgi:integrase
VLREYHETTDRKRQSIGLPPLTDNDFVFCTFNDGKPYLPNSITHAWIKLTRRCGLPGKRLHDCRHSYASLLLRQNVHPSVVANQLGHASVRTTLDIYSHSIPALQEAAAMKFDDIVIGKQA